jgi:tRNA 2-selenouridine synthase SelU
MQKIIISVSKSYIHRGRKLHHRQGTKKKWHVYYYEMGLSDGKYRLKSRRVNWLQAMYYKSLRKHRFKYYCTECGSAVVAFLKSKKIMLECPNCGR